MVVDAVARRLADESHLGAPRWKTKNGARQLHLAGHAVVLVEPLNFMNESGRPVQAVATWYKVAPAQTLVVSDDIDLPFGKLRMRASGSSGGHNGLKSIIAHLGQGFPRLRIGIGRSAPHGAWEQTIGHVLAPFGAAERERLDAVIAAGAESVMRWLADGLDAAMRYANTWKPEPDEGSVPSVESGVPGR
jgi:peptidyl-tRNA hydrolase, PTH1 family